ncbi:MAG: TIR domain-containing protein [Symploca sp. SIO3E6]|nr:TIR domain-containing protein [Caldora sp. SIO3E6]
MQYLFDAFISYGRADSLAFGKKLYTRLLEAGFKIWFDQNDIPLGVDFQNQIDDGIEKSHNFLFVIAPHAINSPYCLKEIELAIKRNKRIIPLLHVEQISRETWQQRKPKGTDEEWEAYKAKGRHSSFPNMHPTIGKINWVYFREGIDDFEQSLAGLIALFQRQADYVEQHTRLLEKALRWEKNKKKTSYLLTGEEKQQAQAWLKVRFKDKQPPCIPTDLHCEFITESIKNGDNLMTQVFLSYSNENRATMEKIRNSLRREGITVWTNTTDIQTGEDFEEAINRGIEQTDNLVYLLSPDSLNSIYCQQELDLASSLNKRIIPILVRETDPATVPSALQTLHYIDLTNNVKEEDYLLDESQLLRILEEDAAYYDEHKTLLTKALKWKRQYSNSSILLRGYNLRSAEAWLKVAKGRTQHLPTPLMAEFIEESLRQPPAISLDVFISYSRKDSDFARKLNDELQLQGKTTWFDQESIASGSDFAEEIKQGINTCDNILFILSPHSLNSPYCKDEVEYAASLNKRFVTVLHRQVNPANLLPELAKVQWIDFNQNEGDFNANFKQLVRTIDTDREHLRHHTKWSQRALEWEEEDRSEDLLLRGGELAIAQNWLQETEEKQKKPLPTTKQQEFITTAIELRDLLLKEREENRQLELKQARQIAIGSVAAGIVMASLALFATYQSRQASIGQIKSAIASAKVYLSSEQKLEALVNSLSAAVKLKHMLLPPAPDLRQQVQATLQRTTNEVQEINRLQGHENALVRVSFSPDGEYLATTSEDGTARLWDLQGNQKALFQGHQGKVLGVSFSPDGEYLATTSEDGTARLWDLQGNQKALFQGHDPELPVMSVSFHPKEQSLATASLDGTIRLWDLQGNQQAVFEESDSVMSVSFSPDGQSLAAASFDGTVRLWDLQGNETLLFDEHDNAVMSVSFSPDGQSLATASLDNTARLWDLQGQEIAKFEHDSWVNDVNFTPDGQSLITGSQEGIARLWNLQGEELREFRGNNNKIKVSGVSISPNGQYLATASGDSMAHLWSLQAEEFAHLHERVGHQVFKVSFAAPQGYLATASENSTVLWDLQSKELVKFPFTIDEVVDISFSPDKKYVAIALTDGTVHLWTIQGEEVAVLVGHDDVVLRVQFSPDGEYLATASEDNTARLWDLQGKEIAVFQGHKAGVADLSFSQDGKYLATASGDNTARLWDLKGDVIRVLEGHKNSVTSVSFSPDSQRVVTASADKTARLWDLQGNELLKLPHQDVVKSVSFRPDGKQLVTTSANGLVDFWNLQGEKLISFQADTQSIDRVNFSSDGEYLATVSYSTARIWQLGNFDTLLSRGCTWVKDYLTTNPDGSSSERHMCDGSKKAEGRRQRAEGRRKEEICKVEGYDKSLAGHNIRGEQETEKF